MKIQLKARRKCLKENEEMDELATRNRSILKAQHGEEAEEKYGNI